MRHVKIGTVWIQEKNETRSKVQGDSNPADLMTKNVDRQPWTRWQHHSSNTSQKDGLRTQNICRRQRLRPASAEEECKDILYRMG